MSEFFQKAIFCQLLTGSLSADLDLISFRLFLVFGVWQLVVLMILLEIVLQSREANTMLVTYSLNLLISGFFVNRWQLDEFFGIPLERVVGYGMFYSLLEFCD